MSFDLTEALTGQTKETRVGDLRPWFRLVSTATTRGFSPTLHVIQRFFLMRTGLIYPGVLKGRAGASKKAPQLRGLW